MRTTAALLVALALLAAACSSSGDEDASEPDAPTGQAAPGPGVDDDTIKLGVITVDVGAAADAIGDDVIGDVNFEGNEVLEAYLEPLQGSEVTGGRSTEIVEATIDPTAPESQREACLELTQDDEVFAVIVGQGFFGDPVLCISDQGETILIAGDGFARFFHDDSDGRLYSVVVSKSRAITEAVRLFEAEGLWDDVTLGVLAPGIIGGKEAAEDGRAVIEDELGMEITEWVELPADLDQVQGQMPTLVERMRASEADTVLLLGNIIQNAGFVSQATELGYSPDYFVTDQAQGVSQIALDAMTVPYEATGATTSLSGSVEAGEPESDRSVACREQVTAETGKPLDRLDEDGAETVTYVNAMLVCDAVEVLRVGLAGADEVLSQRSFIDAVQAAEEIVLSQSSSPGSFSAAKQDAPDLFRLMETDADCNCWVPVSDFAPVG